MKTIILNESQLDKLFINEKLNNMDSPLYHFTTLGNLSDMIKTNMMGDYKPLPKKLRTRQGVNNQSIDNYHDILKYKVDNGLFSGFETAVISFTRDKNSNNGFPSSSGSYVRIKVSPQELLKDRNISLNPYNFFGAEYIKNNHGSPKQNSTILPRGRDDVETEERVIGGIMNLDKKILSIDICLTDYYGGFDATELARVIDNLCDIDNIHKFEDKIHIYNNKNAFNFELISKSVSLDEAIKGLLEMRRWGYWQPFEK